MVFNKLKVHKNAHKGWDNKETSEQIPAIAFAAGTVKLIRQHPDDGRCYTICNLTTQQGRCDDVLFKTHHVGKVVCKIDEPHTRAKIVVEVTYFVGIDLAF